MAMQQSMEGSLRDTLQRVSLLWKKEIPTLERVINYYDQSGERVELPWDTSKMVYEGTAELLLGKHSGSLFISDQSTNGPLFQVFSFEVNRKALGIVQEILLKIGTDPVTPTPQTVSTPAPEQVSSPHSEEMTSPTNDVVQFPDIRMIESVTVSDDNEVESAPLHSLGLAKKEKERLEGEKKILMDEVARVKREKQTIKEESFEIDEQLISAMEQLTAYERQQALMEERHNALLREARLLEEDNLAMKAVIDGKDARSAKDCEMIRQLKVDIEYNSNTMDRVRGENERLVAKCNDLEQQCATSQQIEVFRVEELDQSKENQRIEKELNIFRTECEKLRETDIPSLLKDIEELKQQNRDITQRYDYELQLVKRDRDHFEREFQMIRGYINLDGGEKKRVDAPTAADVEPRDSMKLIDQLSRHFEECSQSLRKLVQLLEANIDAKESQLDRRALELREARNRNDSLVQEVLSRGQKITLLTERLKTLVTEPGAMTSPNKIAITPETEQIPGAFPNYPNNFNLPSSVMPPIPDSTEHYPALASPVDLVTYKPTIKMNYRGLPNVTNTVIDFKNAPLQVMKMNYLELPKSHIGNQVICMLKGSYMIGTLMVVFQYRPSMSGLGTLLPITFAGVQFEEPVGESDGTFKGTAYFRCRANHAEFITVENIYIHI